MGCDNGHSTTDGPPPPPTNKPVAATDATDAAARRVVLRVEQHTFSMADIAVRERVVRQRFPETEGDMGAVAAGQLIRGALLRIVLDRLGEPITPEILDAELARIETHTRDPQALARLQALCGGPTTRAYRELAILPDFADSRYFFSVFPTKREIHADRRDRLQTLLSQWLRLAAPVDFATVAAAEPGLSVWHGWFSARTGFFLTTVPTDEIELRPIASDAQPWEIAQRLEAEVFAPLSPGSLVRTVIERDADFLVVRWLDWHTIEHPDARETVRRIEVLRREKRSAEEFFWDVARTIPVVATESEWATRIRARLPWAKHLKWTAPAPK